MVRAIDRTAQEFGCLLLVKRAPNALHGGREYAQWECLCGECGSRPVYKQEHFTRIEAGKHKPPVRCKQCPPKKDAAKVLLGKSWKN